jgi:MarR family transcriptional regulator, organic hydroperoxide resistance regulator
MPGPFATDDDDELRQAERDVHAAFDGLQLELAPLVAVSNIFRAATAVRAHMEQSVLQSEQLSWSAFVVLFVLRVWGEQDSRALANEAGITPGTLTGVVSTLERRRLVERRPFADDRRRVTVSATVDGRSVVDRIMPTFNAHESMVTGQLSETQRRDLASLLRLVLRSVESLETT